MALTLHYTWLEFKMFTRNFVFLFFTGLFPIFFYVLWAGLNMGGEVEFVVRWLTPSAICWTIMSNTLMNLGIAIPILRDTKVLKRLRGTPMPSGVFVAARALLMFLMVAVQSVLIFILAAVMLEPVSLNWLHVGVVIFGGTLLFAIIAMAIANLIPNGDSAPGICNAVFFPMLFLGGSFFPIENTPVFIQAVGVINPATYLIELMRNLYNGAGLGLTNSYGWLVLAVWLVLCSYIAVARFRWESRR